MTRRTAGFHRTNPDANPRDFRDRVFGNIEHRPKRNFFVPAFSIRRQLFPDAAAKEFYNELDYFCKGKPYQPKNIRDMGMTILDKSRFIGIYKHADVQPAAEEILKLALNCREALNGVVKAKHHLLAVPLGPIAVFGNRNNKIAAVPEGWKGFNRHYPAKGAEGQPLANFQLVREINSVVGEIVQFVDGGVDGMGEYVEIDTDDLVKQAPHFSFAEKTRGNVGNSERVDVQGQIAEFMPDELRFFDPVLHMQLQTPGSIRSDYTNNVGSATISTAGLFVRRPKFDNFGGKEFITNITSGIGIAG